MNSNSIEDIKTLFDSDTEFDEELAVFFDKKTKPSTETKDVSIYVKVLKYTTLCAKLLCVVVTKSTFIAIYYTKKLFKSSMTFLQSL